MPTTHSDRIEVRMFGRLFVCRSTGDVVDADEWSTGKTADLLRLLAISGNRPVSVQSLTSKLWPDVDEDKAKASLRTAASRIRQVIGEPCVERRLGGLMLLNAWTDVGAFQAIANDVSASLHAGEHPRVVSRVREAEALYVAEFQAYDDKSAWATETRESLRLCRRSLLADAGESALALKWMRDAIDFSTLAIADDPCFERPHRTLMRAHAALGEIELALRAFEHCRVCLSQELGADPSPQTRALHIQILSGDAEDLAIKPFVGRADEVAALTQTLADAIAGDGCDVVCISGPSGSGRGALLSAAAAPLENAHVRVLLGDDIHTSNTQTLASMVSERRTDITVWGPCHDDPSWEVTRLLTFFSGLDPTVARVIAVVSSHEIAELLSGKLEDGPMRLHHVRTGPISESDMQELASAALSSRATPRLLQELSDQSENLAGRAVWILRDWMTAGWIISTLEGLDLYNDAPAIMGEGPVGDYFRITLEQLTLEQLNFCRLVALLNRPADAELLGALSLPGTDVEELRAQLDELADLGVLRLGTEGYEFRNRAIRDAFEHNLRPAVKARTRRHISRGLAGEQSG